MLLLSALSAKDFAEAIVLCLCGLLGERGQIGCYLEIEGDSMFANADDVRHQASSSARDACGRKV